MKTNREIDEVKPYLKENDTAMNIAFKAGFYNCIKAVEDRKYNDLADVLKKILLRI